MAENDGVLKLTRVEEYLDQMEHEANKAAMFHGDDTFLWWYMDGHNFISELIDDIPLSLA